MILHKWDVKIRRNLNEIEMEELSAMLLLLENVCLLPNGVDARKWRLETSGESLCKSCVWLLCHRQDSLSFQPFGQIWKARVPPEVKVLAWTSSQEG